jgi:Actin
MLPVGAYAQPRIYVQSMNDIRPLFHRDVTDHLQLLLRKSGHHLHTTAEREVVRTIKEKCCYVALNPSKEEKESVGRMEEFRLPDGNAVQVIHLLTSFVHGR